MPADPLDKIVTFVPERGRRQGRRRAGRRRRRGDRRLLPVRLDATGHRHLPPGRGARPDRRRRSGERTEVADEHRVEMVLPRGRRAAVVAALRAAHPYEEPAFDVYELAALVGPARHRPGRQAGRADDAARVRRCSSRRRCRRRSRACASAGDPDAARCDGWPSAAGRATTCSTPSAASGRRRLRHRRPAPPPGARRRARRRGGPAVPGRRVALGERVAVAGGCRRTGWRARWGERARPVEVRVSATRTDPWTMHVPSRGETGLNAAPADQWRLLDVQALDTRLDQIAHRRRTLPEHAEIDALREAGRVDCATSSSRRRPGDRPRRELAKAEARRRAGAAAGRA